MKKLILIAALLISSRAYARTCAVANGDAQRVVDVATTNASGVVTSASGLFVVGDVGKTVILISGGGVNRLGVNTTTISGFTNATTATLAANANANDTGVQMVWATGDSTAAINTQVTACKAPAGSTWPAGGVFSGTSPGQVTLSGGYIVSGCIYDVNKASGGGTPSLIGSGRYNTVLFPAPTITPCTDPALLIYSKGQGMTLQGIGIEGGNVLQNTANGLVNLTSPGQWIVSDFEIQHYGNANANGTAFTISSGTYGLMQQVIVQNSPPGSLNYQCNFQLSADVLNDVFCSNGWRNVLISSGSSRTPASVGATWVGGGSDECTDPLGWCMDVAASAELQASGIVIFATLRLEAGAVVYLTNGNVGSFTSANNYPAANIEVGAKIYSMGTTWRGNAGSMSIINHGQFFDELGNDYKTCTNNTCTARTAGKSITGNQPITR